MPESPPTPPADARTLASLDHAHVWHPFTPMRQWRQTDPLIIERGEGFDLIDTAGHRYIDGVSSLWCNVHGHRVPAIDQAVREQLDRIAHTPLLGLASPPSIQLAAELVARLPREPGEPGGAGGPGVLPLNKVFYSDAGATAVEAALKMAVGYWHHRGQGKKRSLVALAGAYHGDTTGGMSIGYSDLFHRPFAGMVFPVTWLPAPDACRPPAGFTPPASSTQALWPSEQPWVAMLEDHCLSLMAQHLAAHADTTAALVIEPLMQGAAGMIPQSPRFLRRVRELTRQHQVLLIADEVAVGFGRTGTLFACEQASITPDLMCLGKGISGGYLPLAATIATDEIEAAFTGELAEKRTFYHGHTYTGNPLACAAGRASLRLFDDHRVLDQAQRNGQVLHDRLGVLRDHRHVLDIRQRGLMVGIELCQQRPTPGTPAQPFDFSRRTGPALCQAMREKGLIIRPLGDVLVLMPAPAMPESVLHRMLDIVLDTLAGWQGG